MKAVVCEKFGTPESLSIQNVKEPLIAENEVLIKVRFAGVNLPDNLLIEGKYQVRPPFPFSPGFEVSGDIVALGKNIVGFNIGQKVMAFMIGGAFAEKAIAKAVDVVSISKDMPYETAAGFLVPYGTAYHALKQRGNLKQGERLLVLGAAGGVGLAAVEIGKSMGAQVIAACGNDEKLQIAKEHGADYIINYAKENLSETIKSISNGKGVHVVFDPVGNEQLDIIRCLAPNGRLLVVGFACGEIPKLPLNLILMKEIHVVGVHVTPFMRREPSIQSENMREVLHWYAQGKLHPRIHSVLPLEKFAEALNLIKERKVIGKIILSIS